MAMAMDMDMDLDLDVGLGDEDLQAHGIEAHPTNTIANAMLSEISPPNDTSEPDAYSITPHKVHIRGLDNLTTQDIKTFASDALPSEEVERIEWIDDTSANIIYKNHEVALKALMAFSSIDSIHISQLPALQTIPTRPLPSRPECKLEARLAVLGDRKQAGARERSRFYLFNPEYAARQERQSPSHRKGPNKYRDRETSDYRSRRYDEREQHRRQRKDEDSGFNSSLYDDDDDALRSRAAKKNAVRYSRSASGDELSDRGGRRVRFQGPSTRELFPEDVDRKGRNSGRLRGRSASPVHNDEASYDRKRQDESAPANRRKAEIIKAQLKANVAKELFPMQSSRTYLNSRTPDSADETADLFGSKMRVPFLDGSNDSPPISSRSLASRISSNRVESHQASPPKDQPPLSIKGAGRLTGIQSFSIKGSATEPGTKELFPSKMGLNSGKELFNNVQNPSRRRPQDLFP